MSVLQVVAESPSRRFLGTHLHPDDIPVSFKTKKTKVSIPLHHQENKSECIKNDFKWFIKRQMNIKHRNKLNMRKSILEF